MRQPDFDERREARKHLARLTECGMMTRWHDLARDARQRHSHWRFNPFVEFTARDAAIHDLSSQLVRDREVRQIVTPGMNWDAMAEALLATTPREAGLSDRLFGSVWSAAMWAVASMSARSRRAEAKSIRVAVAQSSDPGRLAA